MKNRSVRAQGARLVAQLFAAFMLIAASAGYASAAGVCRVDVAGTGDGSNWSSPTDLHSALADSSCTEIWVRAGLYSVANGGTFVINRDLGLYGGFAGTESTRDARDPAAHVTTLTGLHQTTVVSMGTVTGTVITSNTVIDGFIIRDGNGFNYGGGVHCAADGVGSECSPVINNVAFADNWAQPAGGGILIITSDGGIANPTITNASFRGGDVGGGGGGGGVAIKSPSGSSSPILYNLSFSDNTAAGGGGALNISGYVNASVFNATFKNNTCTGLSGGAIFAALQASGSASLKNLIVWANTAPAHPQIHSDGLSQVTISHSVVQDAFTGGTWDSSLGLDGGGNTQADPVLGALGNHGGLTETFLPGFGSSAVDAGTDDCKFISRLASDQRGMPRPQGTNCDIGAVEVAYPTDLTIGNIGGSGSVSATANPFLLSGDIAACDGTVPANCTADYAQNVTVQLTATPEPHSSFVGWGGDCSGTGIHFNLLMDGPKNCSADFVADPDAALSVTLDDGRDFAQDGQLLTYAIAIDNTGGSDATAVGVDDTLPSQLDGASAQWQCLPTHGASCAATGTGNISDTINLPAQSSVFYVLTVPVKSGASGTVLNQVGVSSISGTISASDTTTLVLFRNGFEAGGDGSPGLVTTQVKSLAGLSASQAIALPVDISLPSRTVATLAASDDGALRVQAMRLGDSVWLRLLTRRGSGERASAWSALADKTARISLYADSTGSRLVLLDGTRTPLELPMP